jgi:hypothetical protein
MDNKIPNKMKLEPILKKLTDIKRIRKKKLIKLNEQNPQ